MKEKDYQCRDFDIAIIGMSGRFPCAKSIDEFWENIIGSKDCITRNIDTNIKSLDYINAYGILENMEYFDASFFGMSDFEAEMMDPQQRFLLMLTYEALENAGYRLDNKDNKIGLFAGADEFRYVWERMFNIDNFSELDYYSRRFFLGGSLTSRVSYKLNLTGPSITTKEACATSMVTTHMACQSLLNYECDIALSGGVSIYPVQNGYYKAEGTISDDGYTRSFDEKASGFVPGNGAGILVMKRLEDSIRDHDNIYAIIRGSAVNNDGNQKIGFSAPGLFGEINAIKSAQDVAEVNPSDISYIETHGTATLLGDAMEIEALKNVFNTDNRLKDKKRICAIGAVKSNVGHLNIAAGVAGIIKTALMLYNKKLTPSINFVKPNPKLELGNSPFYVNTEYCDWNTEGRRIAGVSSFGIGGTNCHIVMEEAPIFSDKYDNIEEKKSLLLISAKSETALDKITENLSKYLEENKDIPLQDIAYTLQTGRNNYQYKRFTACSSKEEAIQKFKKSKIFKVDEQAFNGNIVFMFPGASKISINAIEELCENNEVFKNTISKCFEYIKRFTGIDVQEYYKSSKEDKLTELLLSMPLTFSVDYALAMLWMSIGIKPDCVFGYSLGEYVAACISGAINLEDALYIVTERCRLFTLLDDGAILTVSATKEQIEPLLIEGVEISAYNADNRLMVSGLTKDIERFINILKENSIVYVRSLLDKPAHCKAVEKILPDFRKHLDKIEFESLKIQMVSTYTGKNVTFEQINDKEYWIQHTRNAVRYHEAVKSFAGKENTVFIEVGFGEQLYKLIKNIISSKDKQYSYCTMNSKNNENEWLSFLKAIGNLWSLGIEVDWEKIYAIKPYKVALPTYHFEGKYYWQTMQSNNNNNSNNQESNKIIVDGLSDTRYELTKYLALNNKSKITIIQKSPEKDDTEFSIAATLEEQKKAIKNIEQVFLKQIDIKCIWEWEGLVEAYDNLCLSSIADYFRAYDLFLIENQKISILEIKSIVKLVEDYYPFMHYLLLILEAKGYVRLVDDMVEILKPITDIPNIDMVMENNKLTHSDFVPYMNLLIECSKNYNRILSGEILGKEILYPNGEYEMITSVSNAIPCTTKIELYCHALSDILKHLAVFQKKKIRILEFGGGTGLVTWKVVEALKGYDIEYCFTDIGRSFLTIAQNDAKEKGYDFMSFKKVDVSKPLDSQGIELGSFDIAIGCNVIQATESIENALVNVKKVLRKSGILCLLQTIKGHSIHEMIFGLCPEWWNYKTDPLRKTSPVLSPKEWCDLLDKHGFSNINILPEENSGIVSDVALILAHYNASELEEAAVNQEINARLEGLKNINNQIEVVYVEDYKSKEINELIENLKTTQKVDEVLQLPDASNNTEEISHKKNAVYRNNTDEQLLKILFDIVGIEVTDLEQPIFELDVDSLSGLLISSRIRNTFNVAFTIKNLYQIVSIKELSNMISEMAMTSDLEENEIKSIETTKDFSDLLSELED